MMTSFLCLEYTPEQFYWVTPSSTVLVDGRIYTAASMGQLPSLTAGTKQKVWVRSKQIPASLGKGYKPLQKQLLLLWTESPHGCRQSVWSNGWRSCVSSLQASNALNWQNNPKGSLMSSQSPPMVKSSLLWVWVAWKPCPDMISFLIPEALPQYRGAPLLIIRPPNGWGSLRYPRGRNP